MIVCESYVGALCNRPIVWCQKPTTSRQLKMVSVRCRVRHPQSDALSQKCLRVELYCSVYLFYFILFLIYIFCSIFSSLNFSYIFPIQCFCYLISCKSLPMTGFELRIVGVGGDRSTTESQPLPWSSIVT